MLESIFSANDYPSAAFDFMSGTLDSRISFSRTDATATRVNESGLIESVLADVPRFDYDPVTKNRLGLLVEKSSVNSCLYSSDFRDTTDAGATRPWAYTRLSLGSNVATSPDGSTTADKLQETATTGRHFLSQTVTIVADSVNTVSVFLKSSERTFARLAFLNTGNGAFVVVDLTTGQISSTGVEGTGSILGSKIENFGNGWYRVSVSVSIPTVTTASIFVYPQSSASVVSYAGVAGSGVFSWGAQIEAGSLSTSYIPTTTATVTRNADVATITGSNFTNLWRVGKGSAVVCSVVKSISGISPYLSFDDTTTNNSITLRGNAANPELYIRSGGSDQVQVDGGTISANTRYCLAGAWATNDCAVSLNSGVPVQDGVATIPAVTQARLGSDGTNYLNGHLEAIEYYDDRQRNSALQILTSQAGRRSILNPIIKNSIFA